MTAVNEIRALTEAAIEKCNPQAILHRENNHSIQDGSTRIREGSTSNLDALREKLHANNNQLLMQYIADFSYKINHRLTLTYTSEKKDRSHTTRTYLGNKIRETIHTRITYSPFATLTAPIDLAHYYRMLAMCFAQSTSAEKLGLMQNGKISNLAGLYKLCTPGANSIYDFTFNNSLIIHPPGLSDPGALDQLHQYEPLFRIMQKPQDCLMPEGDDPLHLEFESTEVQKVKGADRNVIYKKNVSFPNFLNQKKIIPYLRGEVLASILDITAKHIDQLINEPFFKPASQGNTGAINNEAAKQLFRKNIERLTQELREKVHTAPNHVSAPPTQELREKVHTIPNPASIPLTQELREEAHATPNHASILVADNRLESLPVLRTINRPSAKNAFPLKGSFLNKVKQLFLLISGYYVAHYVWEHFSIAAKAYMTRLKSWANRKSLLPPEQSKYMSGEFLSQCGLYILGCMSLILMQGGTLIPLLLPSVLLPAVDMLIRLFLASFFCAILYDLVCHFSGKKDFLSTHSLLRNGLNLFSAQLKASFLLSALIGAIPISIMTHLLTLPILLIRIVASQYSQPEHKPSYPLNHTADFWDGMATIIEAALLFFVIVYSILIISSGLMPTLLINLTQLPLMLAYLLLPAYIISQTLQPLMLTCVLLPLLQLPLSLSISFINSLLPTASLVINKLTCLPSKAFNFMIPGKKTCSTTSQDLRAKNTANAAHRQLPVL